MGLHHGSRPTGNTAGVYTRPVSSSYNGVFSPTLQWIMSAQNTTGLNSNTQYDLSDGNETTYTGNWLSSNTVTRSSYTNHSGITR